jgi:V/A-type H+-transporting ATPase subunit A
MTKLQQEDKLLEIVQLVGSDALPDREQLDLEIARLIREFVLQQNAYHDIDTYCDLHKSYMLMKTVLHFGSLAHNTLKRGINVKSILATKAKEEIANAKFEKDYKKVLEGVKSKMDNEFKSLK